MISDTSKVKVIRGDGGQYLTWTLGKVDLQSLSSSFTTSRKRSSFILIPTTLLENTPRSKSHTEVGLKG